ncbi:MAG: hypothetical protein A2275_04970 [Bacteroidetes bacterium RIFOXYA12_FULL_35_11]|nr:MAG: hypothetical protein A2X01_14740 [Bacteroidetes bacterium GWF2_35_48]OFY75937.1 MAG: hypothetical protein A2275_04970 [Bacteroidetes bacterium RIFOXYA12_FULL_35_11]OFY92475.1 MAG: hypothetical protein A2491_10700 [Bacteroidetes bacterium RIFOXYC12_FULL_35_7]OFY96002.1 MAG: hypothetical protein A2309_02515 [Bacteroidetes bacterium RIFOXYB2_FULL_35_7]HBX51550.1 hypothetical protein [Bacteroidales bacterium]
MARTSSAKYFEEEIKASMVDDNYEAYQKNMFKCLSCNAKIQFNRGIDHNNPHFKNWPQIEHLPTCDILQKDYSNRNSNNKHINFIISTILPRAERLVGLQPIEKRNYITRLFFNERNKQFLSSLISLDLKVHKDLLLRTEDKKIVKIEDIILRQDEIIARVDNNKEPFICILKGFTKKALKVGINYKIPLTTGVNYNNSNKFDLFIPASYVSKNQGNIQDIENKLIYCYGTPEQNKYGYKMDLYSISHQIAIIKKL